MAEYDVDSRTINRTAVAMLKSSASIDKSIRRTYKTKIKSTSCVLNASESVDGGSSITTSQLYSQIAAMSGKPAAVKEPHFEKTRDEKADSFNKICWDVFNLHASGPGDIPFDGCASGIAVGKLGAAVQSLINYGVIREVGDLLNSFLLKPKSMLSWSEFKDFVGEVVARDRMNSMKMQLQQSGRDFAQSAAATPPSTAASNSFKSAVQKQRMASSVVLDDVTDSSRAGLDLSAPSLTRLQGKLMPSHCMKDAIVEVCARDERSKKKAVPKGGLEERSEVLFDDSGILDPSLLIGFHSVSTLDSTGVPPSHLDTESSDSFSKLSASIQKSRVSQLCNPGDEYFYKWQAMKQKRDARIDREFKRRARQDMIHSFSRVVFSTEKNELDRSLSELKSSKSDQAVALKDELRQRKLQLEKSLKNRLNAVANRKATEAQYLRETLRTSAELSRSMKREDTEAKRWQAREQPPFELDSSSSTLIEVPPALVSRVKTAKSLLAYESAKKEVRDFYETTLSDRIANFARAKDVAVRKAALFGSPIALAPIQGEQLFGSDLSLSLTEDGESDSESLAIREYFKHRGVQGHILEEDSLHLGSGTFATSSEVNGTVRSPSRPRQSSNAATNDVPRLVGGGIAFSQAAGSVGSSLQDAAYDDNSSWISDSSGR